MPRAGYGERLGASLLSEHLHVFNNPVYPNTVLLGFYSLHYRGMMDQIIGSGE